MDIFHLELTVDKRTTVQDVSWTDLKQFIGDNVRHADALLLLRERGRIG
jgi:hypothetical protein